MSDNLFSGLEKLGLDISNMDNLFEEAKPAKVEEKAPKPVKAETTETDFILTKSIRCPMCDKVFQTLNVKSARARRIGADADLRPRYAYIDTTKYDVDSCPFCGYTAISRYFPNENITPGQRKLLKEGVCAKLSKDLTTAPKLPETYTYDEAIDRYKLALYNSMVKNAKNSEKAYACLKISWLLRGKAEEAEAAGEAKSVVDAIREDEKKFYAQAYDGLTKAISTENPPICGMDTNTFEYLLAQMAFRQGLYSDASKLVANLLVSRTASSNIKDKSHDLKDQIIAALKK